MITWQLKFNIKTQFVLTIVDKHPFNIILTLWFPARVEYTFDQHFGCEIRRDHQKRISYERCVYESVDDRSLPLVIHLVSLRKAEFRSQRVRTILTLYSA